MERARERWAALVNETLKGRGRDERVDHRSLARQGIDREPGEHYGPAAAHLAEREWPHDRLEGAARDAGDQERLRVVDVEISGLETLRRALTEELAQDPDGRERNSGAGPERDDGGRGRW
jgi:hypothetical protein